MISLYDIYNKLISDSLTKLELNKLASYCIEIARSSVNINSNKIIHLKYSESNQNFVEDVAIDAVSELFKIHKDSQNLVIIRSATLWKNKVLNDADADYFFHNIVWHQVEQTIVNLYKEYDPIFNKIYKTLSEAIRKNNLNKKTCLGKVYIEKENSSNNSCQFIPDDEFLALPDYLFYNKQIHLFNDIFEHLEKETKYTLSIPFNLLVKRIKDVYKSDYEMNVRTGNNFESKLIIKDAVDHGLSVVNKHLKEYRSQNKINSMEMEEILDVFKEISRDILNGGQSASLYEYMHDVNKQLTTDEFYKKNYHRRINYLYSLFKDEVNIGF